MKKRTIILTFTLFFTISILSIKAQERQYKNQDIANLIAKKRDYNKNIGTGYRIQLYNGLETKARSIQDRFRLQYPNVHTKIRYEQPDWKIQVGDYRTRLEADRALNEIRTKFNGAIVIPL